MKLSVNSLFHTIVLSSLFLTGCAIFKGDKKPTAIDFEFDSNSNINYGYSFNFKTNLIYSNGRTKDITNKSELTIDIKGAEYNNGRISIENYPKSFSNNIISVSATYTKNEIILSKKVDIPFNYRGDVIVNFTGAKGDQGAKGSDGGSSLLFRDGKDGDPGLEGQMGKTGDNLTVYVWRAGDNLFRVKVNNLSSGQIYYYYFKNYGFGFKFNVNGGEGGNGGDGGDGGDGKDGSSTDKKTKEPGNGGNGGAGGNGGTGGNGGDVYIFIHPNAAEIQGQFAVYNFPGAGGKGGSGGKGGKAGTPITGQAAANAGMAGIAGNSGLVGLSNGNLQYIIEEFDIEN